MITIFLALCFGLLLAASALAVFRVLAGPTLLDRIVGFDMGAICIIGMVIVLSIYWDTEVFVELMVIFSLLGFVSTVAFVSYLHRKPQRIWHGSEAAGRRKEEA